MRGPLRLASHVLVGTRGPGKGVRPADGDRPPPRTCLQIPRAAVRTPGGAHQPTVRTARLNKAATRTSKQNQNHQAQRH